MFEFFKRKISKPKISELEQMSASACVEVKEKWIYFHSSLHFKDSVALSEKINSFAQPVQEFFHSKYPALLIGSTEMFWLILFTAILESGTHHKDEVNAAIAELQQKPPQSNRVLPPFTTTLQNFINEAQSCAQEFFSNAEYIERELPKVEITDNLCQMTLRICSALKATRDEVFIEFQSWKSASLSHQEYTNRAENVVSLLSKNLNELHVLAISIRAQADINQKFGLASMLIGESATNIYQAFSLVSDTSKKLVMHQ